MTLGDCWVTAETGVDNLPLAVALGTTTVFQCSIEILGVTGTTVDVRYTGLPENQPQSFQDYVAIWQGAAINWPVAPMKQLAIPDNSDPGTLTLSPVQITSAAYTLGFAVGPSRTDICASATLGAGGSAAAGGSVGLSVNTIGTTSLSLHYRTLPGYLPATSGNWIGLWTGVVSPYYAPAPLATVRIPEDINESDVGINGVALTIRTTYTVVYFMGVAASTAAALLRFTTDG